VSVVLVAGAAGQLGAVIVDTLRTRGATLVLADIDSTALERVRDGDLAVTTDLRDGGQVEALVGRAIDDYGAVDAVVNGAGVEGPIAPLEGISTEELVDLYDVNVFGPFRLLKALLPHFKERQQGRIVNVASGAGLAGTEYMTAYSSSKHALVGLTRSLAREVARDHIAVNAVCPGCVESPMMTRIEHEMERFGGEGSFVDAIPARRYATAREVAETVAFLALDAPPYLTGAAIVIDGALRA
jgi:NAD(P)-dependent dehydrogenase (short-subunit alcohol dehydrogenase family)